MNLKYICIRIQEHIRINVLYMKYNLWNRLYVNIIYNIYEIKCKIFGVYIYIYVVQNTKDIYIIY